MIDNMKEVIATTNAPAAIGPYSQAIKVGNTVFVSGQLGINPSTGDLAGNTIEEQARQSLNNIKAILEQAGYAMSDIAKTTCLLADIADFAAFNKIYAEFFEGAVPPARSAFAVKDLPKAALVEIEAIAAK